MAGTKGVVGLKANASLDNQVFDSGITDLNGKFTFMVPKNLIKDVDQVFNVSGANSQHDQQFALITKKAG